MTYKVYLAGPMRGIKDFNFPAFMEGEKFLRKRGWEVFNPAANDLEHHQKDLFDCPDGDQEKLEAGSDFSLRDALGMDLAWICKEADGIVMLPGWWDSKGATAEIAAAVALGLDIYGINEDESGKPLGIVQMQFSRFEADYDGKVTEVE